MDALKQELALLDRNSRRTLTAFLVSLEDAQDQDYLRTLAERIDQPASNFSTLEELDRRLNLPEHSV